VGRKDFRQTGDRMGVVAKGRAKEPTVPTPFCRGGRQGMLLVWDWRASWRSGGHRWDAPPSWSTPPCYAPAARRAAAERVGKLLAVVEFAGGFGRQVDL